MQNNFDKLNEIFGVKKPEEGQSPDSAPETAAPEPEKAHEAPSGQEHEPEQGHKAEPETAGNAETDAEPGAGEEEPAGDETKVLPSIHGRGVFGGKKRAQSEPEPEKSEEPEAEKHAVNPIKLIDDLIYDRSKHNGDGHEESYHVDDDEDEPLEERDYKPIRSRRDGKTGCLVGLMYFVFVISLSIILACVGWMAASDVLALNKDYTEGTVTLPESIFTEKEVEEENEDGTVTTKTVQSADIDYVANVLKDAGIIEYKPLFKLFCKVTHADRKLDPGTYELNTKCDYNALVLRMQTASISMVTTTITFPEGYTMQQIFEKLESEGICSVEDLMDAAANYIYDYPFLEWSEPGDASRLEGYLFPDTYEFYQGEQASSAINKFLLNFHGKLTADMYTQADNLGISLHQAVIVASMIEAEAANNDERANIASVIYNRLNQGMPLQIDATVMYALGEHKEHLTEEDLKVESPYNTYTNTGLPAGPICNPGLASINAALNPASTNYLYYALDTETGTHRFFTSYSEFEAFTATQDYTGN